MQLVRGHGLGNDYLVLEEGTGLTPELVRQLCDRHVGVGSDGVLEPIDGQGSDYGVRIWNPDGSVAEKSGNGLRIYARWLRDTGAPAAFTVYTGHDRVGCEVDDRGIAVEMGTAAFDTAEPETIELVDGEWVTGMSLSMGNPHFVVFGRKPSTPWRSWGPSIEVHRRFPGRTNAQFVRVDARDRIDIRIWERGAGETSASGSSSCAAAAAGVRLGHLDAGRITVAMPGGELMVHVREDWAVRLEGPVEMVGRITVDERWLAARS